MFPVTINSKKYGREIIAIIDTKLTGSLTNRFSKEYDYTDESTIDPTQGVFYMYLIKDIDYELNPHLIELFPPKMAKIANEDLHFYLWVFNYGTKLENKFLPVPYSIHNVNYLHECIRKTLSIIEKYNEIGWLKNPIESICKKCDFQYTCEKSTYVI